MNWKEGRAPQPDIAFSTPDQEHAAGATVVTERAAAELALSGGKTHAHRRAGGLAILGMESRSHGIHAVLCESDTIHDPGEFVTLGRLWVNGGPDVQLLGAILILDDHTREEVRSHTIHFTGRTRPPNTRQRRNVWDR